MLIPSSSGTPNACYLSPHELQITGLGIATSNRTQSDSLQSQSQVILKVSTQRSGNRLGHRFLKMFADFPLYSESVWNPAHISLSMEKEMAAHSSIPACEIPQIEELQPMRLQESDTTERWNNNFTCQTCLTDKEHLSLISQWHYMNSWLPGWDRQVY